MMRAILALGVVAVSNALSDLSVAVKEVAQEATKIVSDDTAATRAAVSAVAEVKSKASALSVDGKDAAAASAAAVSAISSSSDVLKSIETTAKAATDAAS